MLPFRPSSILAALLLLVTMTAAAWAGSSLTPAQEKDVRNLIRQVLEENPEIVIDAIRAEQAKQQAIGETRAREALATNRDQLEHDPASPVGGDKNGDVTIVEFFDYNCGYCKRVLPVLQDFMKADPKVRIVFKEFPILGPQSVVASRAALAAWHMDEAKYLSFHSALMESKGSLPTDRIMKLATDNGIDPSALASAMETPAIDEALANNRALARQLGISGTPAFVIGDKLIPGALNREALEQAVAMIRKK